MMVEKGLQEKIVGEVKRYLERWGIASNGNIGGNIKVGEDALSARVFVEVPNLKRILVEYVGPSLRGVPEEFKGRWANFAVLPRGERNIYLFLDDGLIISEYDGRKLLIEVVPQKSGVVPIFRYVR